MIDVSGQEASGRYVIVQMDNGGDPLNLEEVKAFGRVIGNTNPMLFSSPKKEKNDATHKMSKSLPERHNCCLHLQSKANYIGTNIKYQI